MLTLTEKMIDFIYYVQRSTDANLKAVHKARSPHWHDLKAEIRPVYKYDGEDVRVDHSTIFILYNTPFLSNSNHNPMWIETMENAVKKFLIMPFILFYQNKDTDKCIPIPWEKIYVIKNYNYTYIVLDGDAEYANVQYLRAIVSPRAMTYRVSTNELPEVGWTFNAEGKVLFHTSLLPTTKQVYKVFTKDIEMYMVNTEPFNVDDKGFIIKRPEQGQKVFLDDLVVYKDDFIVADTGKYIEYIEGNAFRFKEDVNPADLRIGVLYYTPSNLSLDNIRTQIDKNEMDTNAAKDVNNRASAKYLSLKDPLDLTNDPTLLDKWYAILAYNKLLYAMYTGEEPPEDDDINNHPHKSVIYTGAEIKAMTINGISIIPNLRWYETYDNSDAQNNGYCKALIFQNGSLIKAVTTTTQTSVSFAIAELESIEDTDIFEVEYLSYNDEGKIARYNSVILNNFTLSEEQLSIDGKLHANNLLAFVNNPQPNSEFKDMDKSLLEYMILTTNIPYVSDLDGRLYCNIVAVDENYARIGLDVKFVAKNRYAFNHFVVEDDEQISFDLSEEFRYCQEINSYLFMINGKMINHKYLKLVKPKRNNPFNKVKIYSQIPAKTGDVVDVYYLPSELKEVYTLSDCDDCGVYTIPDTSILPADLSNEAYWFFLNGKKVRCDKVSFPSNDTIAIEDSKNTNKNLTVIFIKNLIKPYDESEVINDIDEYDGMSDPEIASSIGISPLSGTDEDIYNVLYDEETLAKLIVSEYYNEANNLDFMTYSELFEDEEEITMKALSTRLSENGDSYGVYKSGSYQSDKDIDMVK